MKFLCDVMLGTLAKYLRIAGFDTAYQRAVTIKKLIHIADSEQRFLLTRRTEKICLKVPATYYFVSSNYPREQFKEVTDTLNLKLDKSRFFTRCLLCNAFLITVHKLTVLGKVPEYIFNTVDDFSQCPVCKKIYWQGTHYTRMMQLFSIH